MCYSRTACLPRSANTSLIPISQSLNAFQKDILYQHQKMRGWVLKSPRAKYIGLNWIFLRLFPVPVTKKVSLRNSVYLLRQITNISVSSEERVHSVASLYFTLCINGMEYQLLLYLCWDGLHPIPLWCLCFILHFNGIGLVLFWEFQQFFWQQYCKLILCCCVG